MILQYYGGYAHLERIRELSKTTKKGTSAYHLIEAAKQFGFHAYGVKTKLEERNTIPMPFIAHLKIEGQYYHYVVIYKISYLRETVLIADPAIGIKKISFSKLKEQWTNIAVILYPTSSIEQFDVHHSFFSFLRLLILTFKKETVWFCFLSIFIGLFSLIVSFLTKWMFDGVENEMTKNYFYLLFFTGVFFYFLLHFSEYIRSRFYLIFYQKIELFLTSHLIKRLLYQPQQYYQHRTVGELLSRIEELKVLQNFLGIAYQFFSFDLLMFIGCSIVLYHLNKVLFQIECLFLFLLLALFFITYRIYQHKNYQVKVKKGMFTTLLSDLFSGLHHIQGIHIEKQMYHLFLTKIFDLFHKTRSYQIFANRYQLIYSCLTDITILGQFLIGCFFILEGNLTIGNLFLFELLSNYLTGATSQFTNLYISYGDAKNAYDRVSYLIFQQSQKTFLPVSISGALKLRHLTFSYQEDINVLCDISISIKHGEKILLCGDSGSGKSTLLKLLMKYDEVDRGMITFDGVDICDIKKENLDQSITYVSQKGMLFSDTIENNILLYRRIHPKQFSEVLLLCEIHQILKKHQLGLNTVLDETSNNLSGGEQQRIFLARALLNSFQILLLDEATNQLDEVLEYKIMRLLFWKFSDKTIIVVSHRKPKPHLYDRIFELKNGVLQEVCSH